MRGERAALPPVILLGGTTNALAIARSLGPRGITVLALNDAHSHVRYSRFARWVEPPLGDDSQDSWLRWLTGAGRERWRGSVVVPCADDGVELLARHRRELVDDFILAEQNDEIALAMLDKARTYELAARVGIAAPGTWELAGREDLLAVLDTLPFPCALKPCVSHLWQRYFSARKLFVAESRESLLRIFDELASFRLRLLVTEIIPGADDQFCSYFSYLDENGQPLLHFTKHKLRQYPIHFGIGSYHVSDKDPEVAEVGLRFFQRIGLRGMANVEFKRDARDGGLKLIECNPRFSAANELLTRSGVDFSLFVYNRLTRRPLPPAEDYRSGVRLVRPLEDFASFRAYRRRGELSTLAYLRSLCRRWHTAYFSWRDPWPSVAHGWRTLRHQVAKRILQPLASLTRRSADPPASRGGREGS